MPKKLGKFFTAISNLGKSKKKGNVSTLSAEDVEKQAFLKKFFLPKEEHKVLYAKAERLAKLTPTEKIAEGFRPEKIFHEPIEQLSPGGLTIMSYLYAQKDNDPRQPLIAFSIDDLKDLVKMMDNAPYDSEVTVIFQPMNLLNPKDPTEAEWKKKFAPVHKTVVKIRKTDNGFDLLSLDSSNNPQYGQLTIGWILDALRENNNTINNDPLETGKKQINVRGAFQINPLNAKNEAMGIQNSDFECGTFALKFAREANKNPNLIYSIMTPKFKKDETLYHYEIPTVFFKSAQSSALRKEMKSHADEVVTRANPHALEPRKHAPRTLAQVYEQHQEDYIYHFSKKHHDAVLKFALQNLDNRQAIIDASDRYNAGMITPAILAEYRLAIPQSEMKEKLEALNKDFSKMSVTEIKTEATTQEEDEKPVTIHLPTEPTEKPSPKPSNKPT